MMTTSFIRVGGEEHHSHARVFKSRRISFFWAFFVCSGALCSAEASSALFYTDVSTGFSNDSYGAQRYVDFYCGC